MCEPREPFESEIRNNNQEAGVLADGDANANDIRKEDGGRTSDACSLLGLMTETAEQDKVIVWGTDSRCDDPELAEFEMLECQELEAYLVEEGEDFVGLADRNDIQLKSSSCCKSTIEQGTGKRRDEGKSILQGAGEQESNSSFFSESTEISRAEWKSDTEGFVSCQSTILTLDNTKDSAVMFQTPDSLNITSKEANQPCHSSRRSTINQKDVDMNLNAKAPSEDVVLQAHLNNRVVPCKDGTDECERNNNQRNEAGSNISEPECDEGRNTEHKGLATERESHEGSNAKMDRSTQADDDTDVNYTPHKTCTKGTQSSFESKAIQKQGPFDNTLKKQDSFDKAFKKQPSFDSPLKKQHSFDNTLRKQGSYENSVTSSSVSLEKRKPWGSPSRPTTPTSPKTNSSSPKRRPPGSPAKVQGVRALSLERSNSPQRGLNQTVKLPSKTSLSSGIPKPVMSQQKEPESRKSSPPQKPKNVRPKIITYVRKNPQAKPQVTDVPLEASTPPIRLSSYSDPAAHKDGKDGSQPKSTSVLCSSNLLFDKYRQELHKAGYHSSGMLSTGIKPPTSTIPQRPGRKSDSFHEETPEKYHKEVRN